MMAYWSGGIAPCILDLGTRWRWGYNKITNTTNYWFCTIQ